MINGKTIIALCEYRVYDSQEFKFVTELNELLKVHDCRMFIYAINNEIGNSGDNLAETKVFDLIPYDKVDVVVIRDEKIKSRNTVQNIINKANEAQVPTIIVDGEYENVSLVRYDYKTGFEKVVRHIIEDHHVTRPHFMAGKRFSEFSNERIEVFKKVIAENGIPYDDSMLSYGDFWSVPSREAAYELLNRDTLPEAVICANDIMAINVCDVFQSAGVKIPEQVIVSGFDGIDEAFWSMPGITTSITDSADLAATIMDTILSVLDGNRNLDRWVEPKFIPNESCGCPRCTQDLLSAISGLNNRFYHHQDDIHIMQVITAKVMASQTLSECIHYLRNPMTDYVCCVIEKSCLDLENNFFLEDIEPGEKVIFYDAYDSKEGIKPYNPDEIMPNLDQILELGYPIIYNSLDYMGKSPGFVCYTYPRYQMIEYAKTPSITNSLSMGIGGYVSMRYQHYLRNKLQEIYQYDVLTGLYNRRAFLEKFEELKQAPEHDGRKVTVIMSDLNGLKQINDNLGHSAGDAAISAVAESLKEACPKGALCARFGGDEMLAFILGDCDVSLIKTMIYEILKDKSNLLGFTVSASIGFYETTMHESLDLDKVISIADSKMYEEKRIYKKNKK